MRARPRSTFGAISIALALAALATLNACASLPGRRSTAALYIDAQKTVNGESRLGWTVDRVEIEEAAGQLEPSACRVPAEHRAELRRWIAARIQAEGGPARAQYEAGTDIDDLSDVRDLELVAATLDLAESHLAADCPFWEKPDPNFQGIHSTMYRFVLVAESMGGGTLQLTKGRKPRLGGGGGARLLLSYGLSPHWQAAAGLEGGGDAMLVPDENGTLQPAGGFVFGAPAWLRYIDVDRIYDVELAAATRLVKGELTSWGGRIALAGGVAGMRRLGFMPALQAWIGYELYPAQDGIPTQHALRVGTRVSLDYDP